MPYQALPMYKGPQGSYIFPIQFQTLHKSVASNGAGVISEVVQIKGDIWSQINIEKDRFKKCRLRQCAFELVPKVGFNTNGLCTQFFEYSGDSAATTLVAASKKQQNVPDVVPFKPYIFHWRLQDNKDTEFVNSAADVVFNSTGHYFKMIGEGFPLSTSVWDLYAYCIVDFTEMYA